MLAQAPVEYLLRGISDTMAKYYEAQIAARGRKVCHRDGMGLALSRMCLEPLYAYGEQAVAGACRDAGFRGGCAVHRHDQRTGVEFCRSAV